MVTLRNGLWSSFLMLLNPLPNRRNPTLKTKAILRAADWGTLRFARMYLPTKRYERQPILMFRSYSSTLLGLAAPQNYAL